MLPDMTKSNILEARRRAIVTCIGDAEASGDAVAVRDLDQNLIGEGRPFPAPAVVLAVLGDLDTRTGTGHVDWIASNAQGEYRRVKLTESGRVLYARYTASALTTFRRWLGTQAVTIVVASVTAIATTIAAEATRRWLFP